MLSTTGFSCEGIGGVNGRSHVNRHLSRRADSSACGVTVRGTRLRREFVHLARHRGGGTGDFGADFASEARGAVGVVNGRFDNGIT